MKIKLVQVSRRPQWPLWAVLLVLVWLALGGITVWLSLHLERPLSLCVFKRATDLPCPTCGFTRGVLSLFSGRPDQVWLYNPLLFSVLVLFFLVTGIRVFFARAIKIRLTRMERIIAWLLAAVVLLSRLALSSGFGYILIHDLLYQRRTRK